MISRDSDRRRSAPPTSSRKMSEGVRSTIRKSQASLRVPVDTGLHNGQKRR